MIEYIRKNENETKAKCVKMLKFGDYGKPIRP